MINKILTILPLILLALTIHEVAHGIIALLLGDPTAKQAKRLSLNPFKHIDLTGIIVFSVTYYLGYGIGWAKPIPINLQNLKKKYSIILISAAGPIANLLISSFLSLVLYLLFKLTNHFFLNNYYIWYITEIIILGINLNIILAFFNLLPIPPLDGSKIILGLLPTKIKIYYLKLDHYNLILLLLFMLLPQIIKNFPNIPYLTVIYPANLITKWILIKIIT